MLLSLRPRASILADAHESGGFGPLARTLVVVKTKEKAKGCGCVEGKKTAAILRKLGMPAAAGMHAEKADNWTPQDLFLHAKEEDDKLFPLLRRVAADLPPTERAEVIAEVDALEADHYRVVYPAVARGEMPPADEFAVHGSREDVIVQKYAKQLLAAARAEGLVARTSGVRVGANWGPSYVDLSDVPNFEYTPSAPLMKQNAGAAAAGPGELGTWLPAVGSFPGVPNEKFIDQWWRCIRADESAGFEGPEWENDVAYLVATPANGRDRVAAMRAKINSFWPPEESSPTSSVGYRLEDLKKASEDTFQRIAQDLGSSYRTAEGRTKLANRLGIPVKTIESTYTNVTDAFKLYGYDLEKNLRPLFESLYKQIGPQILAGVKSAVASVTGSAASLGSSATEGFSKALPVVGAFASSFYGSWKAEQLAEDEARIRNCAMFAQGVADIARSLDSKRFPIPWQSRWSHDDMVCPNDGKAAVDVASRLSDQMNLMRDWYWGFQRLDPFKYQSAIKDWWGFATTYMTDDRVLRVFNAMGRDKWGGRLASDEQVMLIAAPIAVANGLDVDEFAAELWNRSGGWSTIDQPGYLYKADIKRRDQDSGSVESRCAETVYNAYWAQFAVLADEAIRMVEDRITTPYLYTGSSVAKPLIMPSIGGVVLGNTRASAKMEWVPLIAGTMVSGAMFLLGVPTLISIVPVGLGAAVTAFGGGGGGAETKDSRSTEGGLMIVSTPAPAPPPKEYSGYTVSPGFHAPSVFG